MDTSYIISQMNAFMFRLSQQISSWLEPKLPKIEEDWWDELVIHNLTGMQRETVQKKEIHELGGLDLAALLRVTDRNWILISSRFFINNKERGNVKTMQEVRNKWAHITENDISKQRVIDDVNTIIALMQAFDAKMKDTRDMEQFIFDVEDDKEIHITPPQEHEKQPKTENPEPSAASSDVGEIQIGSTVTLVSDPSVIGAVIGINGNKYTVFVNGKPQTYYREQIQLQVLKEEHEYLPLPRVRSALTAYQIHNPGSTNLYSLNSARIDFVPYQFRPALRMIQADSPRVLVADDVGVGKTIEAGLILKELEARSSLSSVLVICPRPLVAERKWQLEMKRFDENFTQLDGKGLAECISETDRDGEWPERHSKTIIPYSLFNEDSVMGRNSRSSRKRKNLGLYELDPIPHFDLVIVDEAYSDFSSQKPFRFDIQKYPNLIVLATFSKAWGAAGIRLGMAFASTDIIGLYNKVKYPYNVNVLTQKKAMEILGNATLLQRHITMILEERETLMRALSILPICKKVYPTDANFILARVTDADGIYRYLVQKGVIVRNRNRVHLCGDCLRITVGIKEENTKLLSALRQYV